MATGMQPKELGINYLVLCDNTKQPESFIKIHDYACQNWVGGYRELLLIRIKRFLKVNCRGDLSHSKKLGTIYSGHQTPSHYRPDSH